MKQLHLLIEVDRSTARNRDDLTLTAACFLIRAIIGLLYAVPAEVADYQVSFALSGIGMSTGGWQTAFAVAGAVLAGVTAFWRMMLFVPSADGQGIGGTHSPIGWWPHDQRR